MLLDITKKISRSLDLQEVLNLVMDTLDSLIPYDAAGIFVLQCLDPELVPEGEEPCTFKSEAVRGYDIDELSDLHLKLGEGFIGSVALSGQPIISADVRNDPVYINARDRTRSEMVAPIISNDEVIGVFDLESDELNAYSEDDLEVLMLLASQVAIIIEKVMLHEQLIEKKRLRGPVGSGAPGAVGVVAAARSGDYRLRHQRLQLSDRRSLRRLLRLGKDLTTTRSAS